MAKPVDRGELDSLARDILASRKYRVLAPDFVRVTVEREAAKHRDIKDIEKAARSRLHQTCACYMDEPSMKRAWVIVGDPNAKCETVLALHSSSRERMRDYPEFYEIVFGVTRPPGSIADIACGLNPFSLPYMRGAGADPSVIYAVDVHAGCAALCNALFARLGMPQTAVCADAVSHPPEQAADVALVQKLLPLLEHEGADVPAFIRNINARYVVCTYPTASLGGRDKGMRAHYAEMARAQFPPEYAREYEGVVGNELVHILRCQEG